MRTLAPFQGMEPPNVETFAAQVRMRYHQAIRGAICDLRYGDSPAYWLGVASGQVSVLYDLGASDGYRKLQRVERLRNWKGVVRT